eukprot:GHVQ01025391.1.p1 GENE.GHVQ01025391.1~~GHVQ01025391.1.p1  ORF type:complete len:336 (-),score=31.19 GHVQ01025391.1:581-1588(-)
MSCVRGGTSCLEKRLPLIGLLMYNVGKEECSDLVYYGIKAGYRQITSPVCYAYDKEIGEGIARALQDNLCSRDDLFIKAFLPPEHHRSAEVKEAFQRSLRNLGLGYLDMYAIFSPVAVDIVSLNKPYPLPLPLDGSQTGTVVPVRLADTWKAMEQLVEEGLVRSLGVSNFSCQLLLDLLSYAKIKPSVNQVECHPYLAQSNLLECCALNNVIMTSACCFGGKEFERVPHGTPKGASSVKEPTAITEHPTIMEISKKLNRTCAQVLLRWSIQRATNTTVLVKPSLEHLEEYLASQDFDLVPREIEDITNLDIIMRYSDAGFSLRRIMNCRLQIFDY